MYKKIVSLGICMLLCVTVSSVVGTENFNLDNNFETIIMKNSLFTRGDWLHYDDGSCENALGLTAGGVLHEVIKFTPTELGDYDNHEFITVKVMHGWPSGTPQPAHDYIVWIYTGINHPTDPITEATIVATGTSPSGNDWVDIDIDNYAFNPDDTVWIGVGWTHSAGQFPCGFDTGTSVPEKSGWLFYGTTWTQLHLIGYPGSWNLWVEVESGNAPPLTPEPPAGPTNGVKDVSYSFSATTTDPEEEDVSFMFDWGDGTFSDWTEYVPSGGTGEAAHTYTSTGSFSVQVKAKDINGGESGWSESHTITILESPVLKVEWIMGGLFNVKTLIKNVGGLAANNIKWSISLTGGAFIGKETTGTIASLEPGANETVNSKFILGFGAIVVKVSATIPESTDTKEQNGTVMLFFIKL